MIDLGTLAGLLAHDHQLAAYCQYCDRWVVLDLAGLVDAGLGDRRLLIKVRRRDCSEVGEPRRYQAFFAGKVGRSASDSFFSSHVDTCRNTSHSVPAWRL